MRKLAVFDFDGTLSRSDAYIEFWRFASRRSVRPWLFMPFMIVGVILRNAFPKSIFSRDLMRAYMSKNLVRRLRKDFIKHHLENRFGWAKERVEKERRAGNFTVLISAGADFFIKPLVRDMGFDLVIASPFDLERPWKHKFFCYGENKVAALNRAMKSKPYKIVRAYSDSRSDMPIMSLADEQVWIDSRTGCRRR